MAITWQDSSIRPSGRDSGGLKFGGKLCLRRRKQDHPFLIATCRHRVGDWDLTPCPRVPERRVDRCPAAPVLPPCPGQHKRTRFSFLSQVLSLQDLCCRAVVSCTPVHLVDRLPLPTALRSHLKSFSMATGLNARMVHGRPCSLATGSGHKRTSLRKAKGTHLPQSPPRRCSRNNCKVS